MTRNDKEAIDETQAKLGESCERLLASSAWNRAHTTTHKGLLKRLQKLWGHLFDRVFSSQRFLSL